MEYSLIILSKDNTCYFKYLDECQPPEISFNYISQAAVVFLFDEIR